jgi:Na+-translocating ferredoxin:NAD+ oxidoreductase subunit G
MAKKESTFSSMVLTLFLVTLGASGAMGYVYELTKDAISEAEAAKKNLAIKRVLPDFNNQPNQEFTKVASEIPGDTLYFYIGKMDSDTVGYAIESFSKNAFAGLLKILVGFTPDGIIKSIAVLDHKETPGLGAKITQPDFSNQFLGKNPAEFNLKVSKDGGKVDAITASTITSRAYCEAVQRAYDALQKEQGGDQ